MKPNTIYWFVRLIGIVLLSKSTSIVALAVSPTSYDSAFHAMIAPYIYYTDKIDANDTSVYENMAFPNLVSDLTLQSYLKTHNVQLHPIAIFEEDHGLCYRVSNLIVLKRRNHYICLFYINAAWDLSRSLVYAVYDSSGTELFSKLLSSEDKLLGNDDECYRQAAFSLNDDLLTLWVYCRESYYAGNVVDSEQFQYWIDNEGILH
jgi:hypothetical protein